jgi:hypothetical protein
VWPVLAAGWLVQVAIRLVLVVHQTIPVLIPDESGYLLAGRLLSGGSAGDLSARTFYQAGYAILIAPAFWLSDDPATIYRIVLAINSVIGAVLMLLAYVALRRLEVPRRYAFVFANMVALTPALLYYAQFALTDAVLPVVVFGWLLAIHSWIAKGTPAYAMATSALAAYAYTVHARGAIVLVVQVALLGMVFLWRWAPRKGVAMAGGVLFVGTMCGWTLNGWVKSRIYPGGVAPLGDWFMHRVSSLRGIGWTLSLALGQVWYVIVSTFGIAGVGLLVMGVLAVRRGTPRPTRVVVWVTLASVAGIALATSAAVPDEGTVANFAYGRYLSCLTPVLFVTGLAFLWRASRERTTRAVLVTAIGAYAAAAVIWLHAGVRLSRGYFGPFDFPEICVLTGTWDHLRIWSATGLALLPLALATLVLIGYRRGLFAVAATLVVLDVAIAAVFTNRVSRYWADQLTAATSLTSAAGLSAEDRVGMNYPDMPWRIWVSQAFQARNGLRPIDRFHHGTLPPGLTLVVVPWDVRRPVRESWPAAPAGWRPVTARRSYLGGWAAWRPKG